MSYLTHERLPKLSQHLLAAVVLVAFATSGRSEPATKDAAANAPTPANASAPLGGGQPAAGPNAESGTPAANGGPASNAGSIGTVEKANSGPGSKTQTPAPSAPGGKAGVANTGGTGGNPIDLGITVYQGKGAGSKKATKTLNLNSSKTGKVSGPVAKTTNAGQASTSHTTGGITKNAVGVSLNSTVAGAKGSKSDVSATGPRVTNGPTTNAIGSVTSNSTTRVVTVVGTSGKQGSPPPSGAAPANGAILNGTGLARVASHVGAVGGATKNAAGAINGTAVGPKR
jgi:hypothetical protein